MAGRLLIVAHANRDPRTRIIGARKLTRSEREAYEKEIQRGGEKADELRPEYDLAKVLKGGVQGKYVERYREGTNLALLAPDVAESFPNPAMACLTSTVPQNRQSQGSVT